MKKRNILVLLSFIILVDSSFFIFGKPLLKFQKQKIRSEKTNKNVRRYLDEKDNYDTYIILSFKEDCNYSNGFYNYYRNNIDFIINKENNDKLTSR